jgi:hypothetical protein
LGRRGHFNQGGVKHGGKLVDTHPFIPLSPVYFKPHFPNHPEKSRFPVDISAEYHLKLHCFSLGFHAILPK